MPDLDLERREMAVSALCSEGRGISRLPIFILKLKHYKNLISSARQVQYGKNKLGIKNCSTFRNFDWMCTSFSFVAAE